MAAERYLGVGLETNYGSAASISDYIKIIEEDINEINDYYEHETVAYRALDAAYVTKRHVEGGFSFLPRRNNCHKILYAALGSYTEGSTEYTYQDGTSLPSLTIAVGRPTSGEAKYTGCKINKLEINAEAGNPLVFSVDVLGKEEYATGGSLATPTYTTDQVYLLTNGSVEVGGVSKNVKAISITLDNAVDVDNDIVVGSLSPVTLKAQGLKIEGDFTLTDPDSTIYSKYRSGDSASLKLTCYGKTANGTAKKLIIEIPKAYFVKGSEGPLSKRERNEAEYSFRAAYSTNDGYTIKITREL